MKAKKHPNRAIVLLRVTEIARIRLDGAKPWDVAEYVREKEAEDGSPWKLADGDEPLSERQMWRYITMADKMIAEATMSQVMEPLMVHLARRENMYAKAINAGDINTALAVAKDDAKLRGLYPSAKQPDPVNSRAGVDCGRYRNDPLGYIREVLKVDALTPEQVQICEAATKPPHRVLVPSGHDVGKSFIAACLACWWYDTRNPGVCLTTAPTERQVKDILWKEVRKLRERAGLPGLLPKDCRMESAPDHFAHGFTARESARFQGQHEASVCVIFDEAEGVDPQFWEAADTMLASEDTLFVALYNPTQQAGPTADAEREASERGTYAVINCATHRHPNIAADLAGELPPVPAAIRLSKLRDWCAKWADKLQPGETPLPTDFQVGDEWFRPSPVGEARILGRRPSTAFGSIWSQALFDAVATLVLPETGPLQIGCDVAWFGDDESAIHVRKGGVSLHHESYAGIDTTRTARRCMEIAEQYGQLYKVPPRDILIAVDVIGYGAGVYDQLKAKGYRAVKVNVSEAAPDPDDNANLRATLWFGLAELARRKSVSFARLPQDVRGNLRRELTAPTYTIDGRGRQVVERKEDTKKRLGRSPDNADACLLAYASVRPTPERVAGRVRVPQ